MDDLSNERLESEDQGTTVPVQVDFYGAKV